MIQMNSLYWATCLRSGQSTRGQRCRCGGLCLWLLRTRGFGRLASRLFAMLFYYRVQYITRNKNKRRTIKTSHYSDQVSWPNLVRECSTSVQPISNCGKTVLIRPQAIFYGKPCICYCAIVLHSATRSTDNVVRIGNRCNSGRQNCAYWVLITRGLLQANKCAQHSISLSHMQWNRLTGSMRLTSKSLTICWLS